MVSYAKLPLLANNREFAIISSYTHSHKMAIGRFLKKFRVHNRYSSPLWDNCQSIWTLVCAWLERNLTNVPFRPKYFFLRSICCCC